MSNKLHLGGHANITHIDTSALQMMKEDYNVKSLYDLGCGPGGMIAEAQRLGLNSVGIDGDTTLKYPKGIEVITCDFTIDRLDSIEKRDACWSCEFLEHVEEKYMDNYFSVFEKVDVVFCTFSLNPNAHHHVNVKPQMYWEDEFRKRGFDINIEKTLKLRDISSMPRDFVRDTGMVMEKII
jgi:SAM-dependent methyltransferase